MGAPEKTPEILQHGVDSCELVAKEVAAIATAAKRILDGPLTMNAVCILVREAIPRGMKGRITEQEVYAVLQGAANMKLHLKGGR